MTQTLKAARDAANVGFSTRAAGRGKAGSQAVGADA